MEVFATEFLEHVGDILHCGTCIVNAWLFISGIKYFLCNCF